jgi:hypothetical protein
MQLAVAPIGLLTQEPVPESSQRSALRAVLVRCHLELEHDVGASGVADVAGAGAAGGGAVEEVALGLENAESEVVPLVEALDEHAGACGQCDDPPAEHNAAAAAAAAAEQAPS